MKIGLALYVIVGLLIQRFYPGIWPMLKTPPFPYRPWYPVGEYNYRAWRGFLFALIVGALIWPYMIVSDLIWRFNGKPPEGGI